MSCIYRADQEIYPSDLSLQSLMSWIYAGGHHFSHRFMVNANDAPAHLHRNWPIGIDDVLVGTIITLPLKRNHWEDLLDGNLPEPEIGEQHLVQSPAASAEVGLHVFHIEKEELYPGRGFTRQALAFLQETARVEGWKVVGYSGMPALVLLTLLTLSHQMFFSLSC